MYMNGMGPMYPMNNMSFGNQYEQRPVQQPSNAIVRVSGIDGAKAYQMPANSMTALFDNNEDKFYIKVTDGAGFPTIRTFSFTEDTNTNTPTTSANYVDRSEFDKFRREMMEYVEQFIPANTTAKTSTAKHDANVKRSESPTD